MISCQLYSDVNMLNFVFINKKPINCKKIELK